MKWCGRWKTPNGAKRSGLFAPLITSLFLLWVCGGTLATAQSGAAEHEIVHTLIRSLHGAHISVSEFTESLLGLDSGWSKDRGIQLADSRNKEAIGEALKQQTTKVLLEASSSSALEYREAAKKLLGEEHSVFKRIARLVYIAERSEILAASGEAVKLDSLGDETKDEVERQIINRRKTSLFHATVKEKTENGQADVALVFLTEIDPEAWNSETVTLTLRTLRAVNRQLKTGGGLRDDSPLNKAEVKEYLSQIEASSMLDNQQKAELRELVTELISQRILLEVRTSAIPAARRSFELLLSRRPDPSEKNDALRFQIALAANSSSARRFGQSRIDELQKVGELSLGQRLDLLVAGFYGSIFPIVFYTVLVCGVIAMLAMLIIPAKMASDRVGWLLRILGRRAFQPGYLQEAEDVDEYSSLLEMFGLDDGATTENIRHAYRQVMKDYHPDKVRNRSHEEQEFAAERFEELKCGYERLMEIKGAHFGGRAKPS